MLYTCYFAKEIALKENGIVQVAISRSTPNFYNGLSYSRLAPPWSIIKEYKEDGDWEKYTKRYKSMVLDKLNPRLAYDEIMRMVKELTGKEVFDVALMCYEKSGTHCHRELVSLWFNDAGIQCKEWFSK